MLAVLVALTIHASPCGLTEEDLGKRCEADAGVPTGIECWEQLNFGNGRWMTWTHERRWLDPAKCTVGSLIESGGGGSPSSLFAVPDLPKGLTRAPAIQKQLAAALIPPPESATNTQHALARLNQQLPRTQRGRTALMPTLQWWPGPVPQPVDSSTTSKGPSQDGACPCHAAFSGSKFKLLREWSVGTQTLTLWGNGARNQELAVAVTDEGARRHRWIHLHSQFKPNDPFVGHVEGTRWWLPLGDLTGEESFVLGYDAKTGQAWRVKLGEVFFGNVSDAGVQVQVEDAIVNLPWSSLGP